MRWYDPETGRFTSEDPVKDGKAWYAYAANNPMKYIDQNGLDTEDGYGPEDGFSVSGALEGDPGLGYGPESGFSVSGAIEGDEGLNVNYGMIPNNEGWFESLINDLKKGWEEYEKKQMQDLFESIKGQILSQFTNLGVWGQLFGLLPIGLNNLLNIEVTDFLAGKAFFSNITTTVLGTMFISGVINKNDYLNSFFGNKESKTISQNLSNFLSDVIKGTTSLGLGCLLGKGSAVFGLNALSGPLAFASTIAFGFAFDYADRLTGNKLSETIEEGFNQLSDFLDSAAIDIGSKYQDAKDSLFNSMLNSDWGNY